MNSPAVREYGDLRIAAGERCVVVDLDGCTGMDSTFMGTLAGLAGRLTEGGGALQVVGTCAKTRGSLEDLGLDFLMEIEPAGALWCGQEEGVRAVLDGQGAEMKAGSALHSSHVLEAHQTLSDANDGNREKFSGVLKVLGEELSGLSAVPRSGG